MYFCGSLCNFFVYFRLCNFFVNFLFFFVFRHGMISKSNFTKIYFTVVSYVLTLSAHNPDWVIKILTFFVLFNSSEGKALKYHGLALRRLWMCAYTYLTSYKNNTTIPVFICLQDYTYTLNSTWTFQKQLYCSMSETKKSGNH